MAHAQPANPNELVQALKRKGRDALARTLSKTNLKKIGISVARATGTGLIGAVRWTVANPILRTVLIGLLLGIVLALFGW